MCLPLETHDLAELSPRYGGAGSYFVVHERSSVPRVPQEGLTLAVQLELSLVPTRVFPLFAGKALPALPRTCFCEGAVGEAAATDTPSHICSLMACEINLSPGGRPDRFPLPWSSVVRLVGATRAGGCHSPPPPCHSLSHAVVTRARCHSLSSVFIFTRSLYAYRISQL